MILFDYQYRNFSFFRIFNCLIHPGIHSYFGLVFTLHCKRPLSFCGGRELNINSRLPHTSTSNVVLSKFCTKLNKYITCLLLKFSSFRFGALWLHSTKSNSVIVSLSIKDPSLVHRVGIQESIPSHQAPNKGYKGPPSVAKILTKLPALVFLEDSIYHFPLFEYKVIEHYEIMFLYLHHTL